MRYRGCLYFTLRLKFVRIHLRNLTDGKRKVTVTGRELLMPFEKPSLLLLILLAALISGGTAAYVLTTDSTSYNGQRNDSYSDSNGTKIASANEFAEKGGYPTKNSDDIQTTESEIVSDCGREDVPRNYSTQGRIQKGNYTPEKKSAPPNKRGFWAMSTEVGQKLSRCVEVYSTQPEDPAEMVDRMQERKERQVSQKDKVLFTDVTDETGITFEHDPLHATTYTSMAGAMFFHYHSVATADVDGNGYQDLYFVNQAGPNELWLNRGNLEFENATGRSGTKVSGEVSSSASFGDIDNDGDSDLYVTTLGGKNKLFENTGEGTFQEISTDAGVDYDGYSSSSVFFDYNGDGLLDLYVVNLADFTSQFKGPNGYPVTSELAFNMYNNWTESSALYINNGSSFERVDSAVDREGKWDKEVALVPDPGSPPGLYVANMDGRDGMFENTEAGLIDVTSKVLDGTPYGSFDVSVLDTKNDGMFDIYVTDKHSEIMVTSTWEVPEIDQQRSGIPRDAVSEVHMDPRSEMNIADENLKYGSALYENTKDGYNDVSDETESQTELPWGVSVGDLNSDGYEDLLVTSGMEFRWYVPDAVLINDGSGGFERSEFRTGLHPRDSRYTTWGTVDCSEAWNSRIEDICENSYGTPINGTVDIKNHKSSRGSVIVDLNNDGAQELVVNQFNGQPRIIKNTVAEKSDHSYLSIELVGTDAPRDGTGAVATLTTSEDRYHRFADGKSYHAQNQKPLYFGFDDGETVKKIEVNWATGDVDRYEIDEEDRTVTLNQR